MRSISSSKKEDDRERERTEVLQFVQIVGPPASTSAATGPRPLPAPSGEGGILVHGVPLLISVLDIAGTVWGEGAAVGGADLSMTAEGLTKELFACHEAGSMVGGMTPL